jgi:periplasmic divalent cation tolerance protein
MPKKPKPVLLYVTAGSRREAEAIAKALLEAKRIACANILGPLQSFFVWKGKLQNTKEHLILCKTTESNVSASKKIVLSLHSYECPCITVLPITDGHESFLHWISGTVR